MPAPSSEEPVFAFSAGKTGGGGRAKGRPGGGAGQGAAGEVDSVDEGDRGVFTFFFCRVERIKIASHVLYAEAEPGDEAAEEGEARRRSSCVARLETRCAHAVGPTAQACCAAANLSVSEGDAGGGVDGERFSIWQCWKPERSLLSRSASSSRGGQLVRRAEIAEKKQRIMDRTRKAATQKWQERQHRHKPVEMDSLWDSGAQQGQLFFLGPSLSPLYRPLEKRVVRHVERRSPTCY